MKFWNSMSFCCLRTTFLYPNRRVEWIRSWLLPWAWAPYADDLRPRRKTWRLLIYQAYSFSRAHARMQCVCVCENWNWAPAVRPLRIGYRKWCEPNRQWCWLLQCIVMAALTKGLPSACILLEKIRKKYATTISCGGSRNGTRKLSSPSSHSFKMKPHSPLTSYFLMKEFNSLSDNYFVIKIWSAIQKLSQILVSC